MRICRILRGRKFQCRTLAESESARLNKLEQTLHKRVVGQEEAVSSSCKIGETRSVSD
ncbi:MAG: hypothetical protein ACLU80_10185 [Dorea sp.]